MDKKNSLRIISAEEEAIIIAQSAQGMTQRAIAAQIGCSHTTVDRHQDRLRDLIQREAAALLNRGLISARRTVCRLAAAGNDRHADDAAKKLALEASKTILSAAQITGNNPSTVLNTLIQITPSDSQSATMALLSDYLQAQMRQQDTERDTSNGTQSGTYTQYIDTYPLPAHNRGDDDEGV